MTDYRITWKYIVEKMEHYGYSPDSTKKTDFNEFRRLLQLIWEDYRLAILRKEIKEGK